MAGHQDASSSTLDDWAILNIQMDKEAKQFWEQLNQQGYVPSSQQLLGEGWTIWQGKKKLSSLQSEYLMQQTQARYSSPLGNNPPNCSTPLIVLTGN